MSVSETSDALSATEIRSVSTLCLLYITRMLGLFMVLPVFAIYLADYQGFSYFLLGVALGVYGLTQGLMQLPFGFLSDRFGRKPIILFGLLLFCVGSVVAALADSITGVIIGRALQGCGAIASTIMATVADVTRDESRSKAMAMIGASIGLSFALAMVLGPKVTAAYGLVGIFWLTAGLAIVGILLVIFLVPTPAQSQHSDALPSSTLLRQVISDRQLQRYDFGIFCLHMVLTASFVVIPSLLETTMQLPPANHGFTYLLVLGAGFVVMLPIMIGAERKGLVKTAFLMGISFMLAGALAVSLLYTSPVWFVTAWFVFFVGFNLLEALLPSLLSRQVLPGGKGTAMGVYSTCQFLGMAAGGVVGGALAASFGPAGVFGFAAAVLLLWLIVAVGMVPPAKSKTLMLKYKSHFSAADLSKQVGGLLGVLDVSVMESEQLAYVKVLAKEFDVALLDDYAR